MIAICCAMEEELAGVTLRPDLPVFYTGIGKVNAALASARLIHDHRPELIINFGTAGAVNAGLSGLVECGSCVQRDLDLRALGFPLGGYFGQSTPDIITWGAGYTVATGDQFSTSPPEIACDLVDMEAYAIAKTCKAHGIPFRCLKFISDNADAEAAKDWSQSANRGAELFRDWVAANLP